MVEAAHEAGLLVVADGKRADVPVSAEAYADALLGSTETPWGAVPGLGADAVTLNPLLGARLARAARRRRRRGGRRDLRPRQDLQPRCRRRPRPRRRTALRCTSGSPRTVDALADRLAGSGGFSGAGAVVGATEPRFLARLRELMPRAIFLLPGVGAQGGSAERT